MVAYHGWLHIMGGWVWLVTYYGWLVSAILPLSSSNKNIMQFFLHYIFLTNLLMPQWNFVKKYGLGSLLQQSVSINSVVLVVNKTDQYWIWGDAPDAPLFSPKFSQFHAVFKTIWQNRLFSPPRELTARGSCTAEVEFEFST